MNIYICDVCETRSLEKNKNKRIFIIIAVPVSFPAADCRGNLQAALVNNNIQTALLRRVCVYIVRNVSEKRQWRAGGVQRTDLTILKIISIVNNEINSVARRHATDSVWTFRDVPFYQ